MPKRKDGIIRSAYSLSVPSEFDQTPIFLSDNTSRDFFPVTPDEVREMISHDYGKDSVAELDVDARLSIARKLRYSYASTLKQISRMVHLDRTVLEGFI